MSETAETTIPANEAPAEADRGAANAAEQDNAPAHGEAGEGEQAEGDKPEQTPKREDWRDVRMRQYVARARAEERARNEAERRAQILEAELQAFRRLQARTGQDNAAGQGDPARQPPQEQMRPIHEIEREAEQRAAARMAAAAEEARFNESCNRTAEAGLQAYSDFDRSITGWNREGLDMAGNHEHRDLVNFINSLPNAAHVFYRIGTTPNEAAHLLSLSPRQQAIEINRIAVSAGKTPAAGATAPAATSRPAASNAPAPPRQAASAPRSSSSDLADPNMSIEKWMEARNKATRR